MNGSREPRPAPVHGKTDPPRPSLHVRQTVFTLFVTVGALVSINRTALFTYAPDAAISHRNSQSVSLQKSSVSSLQKMVSSRALPKIRAHLPIYPRAGVWKSQKVTGRRAKKKLTKRAVAQEVPSRLRSRHPKHPGLARRKPPRSIAGLRAAQETT